LTIQWLSSKRVEGDDAEKDTIPVTSLESGYSFTALDTPQEYIWNGVDTWVPIGGAVGTIGGWKEIARETLTGSGLIDVQGIANKRYYMLLINAIQNTPTNDLRIRFNSDSAMNYSDRGSQNGATDFTEINTTQDFLGGGAVNEGFNVSYISNLVNKEKLLISNYTQREAVGAGTPPRRDEAVGKWANTTEEINRITTTNSFDAGSEMVVLEFDPLDTHTDNFWEEIADVTLGADGDTITATFPARKYLWIQGYVKSNGSTRRLLTFNDDKAVSNQRYASRESTNGATDGTNINADFINLQTGLNAISHFFNIFVVNNGSSEKLALVQTMDTGVAGAGNPPARKEQVFKWVDVVSLISRVDIDNNNVGGDFEAGSLLKVWGAN